MINLTFFRFAIVQRSVRLNLPHVGSFRGRPYPKSIDDEGKYTNKDMVETSEAVLRQAAREVIGVKQHSSKNVS